MEVFIKDKRKMVKEMEKENLFMLTVDFMMEIG